MKKILVIDDEPPVARLIAEALNAAEVEHTLDYFSDGGQGRVKAAQGDYDLIALDLAMPFMDGIEALTEMKQNPKTANIPVIVVTGVTDPQLHQKAMALGAAALIVKPFRTRELADTFEQVLSGEQVGPPPPGRPGSGLSRLGEE